MKRRSEKAPEPAPLRALDPFFSAKGWQPFPFQQETWNAYLAGKSGLLHAPTGLGKTLAVWGGPLAEAIAEPPAGCGMLWLTPLRALAQDTLKALRDPIEQLNLALSVEARTGDTPAHRRAKLRERLPFALVTTPESLSLMLTYGDFRDKISGLRAVIIDEWHELLGTKRGVQTELCLARLRQWLPNLRVWGLSATLGNLDEARDVLLGDGAARGVTVSSSLPKAIEIKTLIPKEIERFPWSGHLGTKLVRQVAAAIARSRTTLLFTNTRSQTEIWFQELLAVRPHWIDDLAMHHGSLDREERKEVEQRLRDGNVRCVVCTSSLDLGVDFSPVGQVIQVGSPKGVARLLQRAGRSGHQPGKVSRILGVPTNALELVEFAAVRDAAERREIESRPPLRKPLDLLVQHLVTCAIGEPFTLEEMLAEIRSTFAYRDLTQKEWDWAIGFITSGGDALKAYPNYQRAREVDGRLAVTDKRHIQLQRMSIGTISSDTSISIRFASGRTLGSVEEGFISRIRPGGQFVFAGRRLELVRIHQQVATVKPGKPTNRGQIAIWGGAKMPLSTELSHAVARRLRGEGPPAPEIEAVSPILDLQRKWSALPDDEVLHVEHTQTKEGEHLFVFPFAGRLVHEGLGALTAYRFSKENGESIQVTMNDYGFGLTARRGLPLDERALRAALTPDGLLDDLVACMNTAELARRQFREIARVAGLVLQTGPGPRKRTRDLQISASLLYEVFRRYDPDNLLLDQARREILERQLDLTRLKNTLFALRGRPLRLVETDRLTPMAFPLWADRLQAFLASGIDPATRLEAMLRDLEQAAQTGDDGSSRGR